MFPIGPLCRIVCLTLATIFYPSLLLQAQEQITLEQALKIALENNIQIKKLQLRENSSEISVKESKLARLPTLNAGTNFNFNFGRTVDPFSYDFVNQQISSSNGSIYTNVPIFQGFQYLNKIAQNKFILEADKSATQQLRNDLALTVVITYLQVLNYQDVLKVSLQQLEVAKQELDNIRKQFNVNSKTAADISLGRARVSNATLNQVKAENQLALSFLNLAQLMERNPGDRFEVVHPAIADLSKTKDTYSAEDIYTIAVEKYPEVQLAKFRTLAAEKSVSIAKGGLYPKLLFQGSLASGYSSAGKRVVVNGSGLKNEKAPIAYQIDKNLNQTLGFNLSIPIFNGYNSKFSLQRAKITLTEAQYDEQLSKNNFNKIIYQAVADVQAAKSTYDTMQAALTSSTDAYNAIKKRYAIGLVNALEFNQAQADFNKIQFEVIQGRYDLILKSKIIDFYLGNTIGI